jgi:ATP-dependent Clp protease protease subunit
MQHQPSQQGGGGTASDIEIQAKEVVHLRTTVNRLMARHTGRPVEQIERDFDRDFYMSAEQAKAYGIIDHVVAHRGDVAAAPFEPAATA